MSRFAWWLAAVLLMSSVIGCEVSPRFGVGAGRGNDDDDAGVDPSPDAGEHETAAQRRLREVRDALRPIALAHCEWMFECCQTREVLAQLRRPVDDEVDCAERLLDERATSTDWSLSSVIPARAPALDALAPLAYDPALRSATIDVKAARSCGLRVAARACNEARERGAHCVAGSEPELEPECELSTVVHGLPREGERCNPALGCAAGTACRVFAGPSWVCVKLGVLGDSCTADHDCDESLVCNASVGKCAAGAELGRPCDYADRDHPAVGTETLPCARGLTCDPTRRQCVDPSCAWGSSCLDDSDCPKSLVCTDAGTCSDPLGTGAWCSRDVQCASGRCSTSCLAPGLANGKTCTTSLECKSGYCRAGECAAQLTLGAACLGIDRDECKGGACDARVSPAICADIYGEGEPCGGGTACASGLFCLADDGLCHEWPLLAGVPCNADGECAERLCVNGLCRTPSGEGVSCFGDERLCERGFHCGPDALCHQDRRVGETCSGNACGEPWACEAIAGEQRCTSSGREEVLCTGER